jgi:hypothetical protein
LNFSTTPKDTLLLESRHSHWVFGRNPDSPIAIALNSTELQVDATTTLLKFLHAAWADAKDCLSFGQAQQVKFDNEYQKSRDFNPGDLDLV